MKPGDLSFLPNSSWRQIGRRSSRCLANMAMFEREPPSGVTQAPSKKGASKWQWIFVGGLAFNPDSQWGDHHYFTRGPKNYPSLSTAWRAIPVSQYLVTTIYKPFRPFGRGTTPSEGTYDHHDCKPTYIHWDDPPSGYQWARPGPQNITIFYMSCDQNPGWFGSIGNYTTHLYRDYFISQ